MPPFVCPGKCHSGSFADFDHFCDAVDIEQGEEGIAFAMWMEGPDGKSMTGRYGPVVEEETTH